MMPPETSQGFAPRVRVRADSIPHPSLPSQGSAIYATRRSCLLATGEVTGSPRNMRARVCAARHRGPTRRVDLTPPQPDGCSLFHAESPGTPPDTAQPDADHRNAATSGPVAEVS